MMSTATFGLNQTLPLAGTEVKQGPQRLFRKSPRTDGDPFSSLPSSRVEAMDTSHEIHLLAASAA